MWQILQYYTISPNVTATNAPYRVRVIEMIIEVTFEATLNILLQYLTFRMQHFILISLSNSMF